VIYLASTNKTANLGLSQWEAADAVQMADFNADNAKIDEALGGLMAGGGAAWVKLMDVEVTKNNTQVSLDLSKAEADGIMALEIYADLDDLEQVNYYYLRINGEAGEKYTCYTSNYNSSQDDSMELGTGIGMLSIRGRNLFFKPEYSTEHYVMSRTDFPQLVSLDFLADGSGLRAGDKVVVWGLKR